MNKTTTALAIILTGALHLQAATLFSDSFSYPDGPLAGQGTWTQNGASAVNPVQVSNGRVLMSATGQDLNAPLASPLTLTDGMTFTIGATINVTSASTSGDYFLHWSPALNSTTFISRLYLKSDSVSGFLIGYVETSGTGASLTYGTQSLSYGTDYQVVIAYNSVAGAANDTASVYVNPTGDLSANTPYLSDTWNSITGETSTVGAINLRQGGANSGAVLAVDNLSVQLVPEPATGALLGLGVLGLLVSRRRQV